MKKAYNSHEDKIKFTYMEQKEYEKNGTARSGFPQ